MGSLETIQSGAENCKALMSWDEGGGYRTTSDLSGVVRFDFESMGGAFFHQEAPTTHDHHPRAPPTLAPAIHSPVSEFAVVSNSLRPMDCSPPGFSDHGISQASILGWVAISFSRGSSDPGIESLPPVSPALAGGFTAEPPGKPRSPADLLLAHNNRTPSSSQQLSDKAPEMGAAASLDLSLLLTASLRA